MPPRRYPDLTPEQLDELDSLITPHAPVPRLPVNALASRSPRALSAPDSGDDIDLNRLYLPETTIRAGGEQPDEAWLDSLIASPPQAPRALSAAGPGGATFDGVDTPESRELVKQRGMQVTSTPTDDDLLDALASERPATMPQLDEGDDLDDLIRAEGAAMAREQASSGVNGGGVYSAPRQSREDALLESLQPPSQAQGWLAVLGDALYGGHMVDNVNARRQQYEGALAQARMQDVAAGERADEQAADRQMTDARLRETARAHDQAMERAQASLAQRQERGGQIDERIRSEGVANRAAAGERADKYLQARADAGAPDVTPEQQDAGIASMLADNANTTKAEAAAFMRGQREGLDPEKVERLERFWDQWKIMSAKKQQDTLAGGFKREATSPDAIADSAAKKRADPKARLELKTGIDETGRDIARASRAWAKMSPQGKAAFAKFVPEGNFEAAVRQGLMSPEDQKLASDVQALANGLVKARAGSAVTGSEWKRVAGEIGFPMNNWAVFNSPEVIQHWIDRAKQGWVSRVKNTRSEYGDLWGANGGP